jgi:hypothetical protein
MLLNWKETCAARRLPSKLQSSVPNTMFPLRNEYVFERNAPYLSVKWEKHLISENMPILGTKQKHLATSRIPLKLEI